MKKTIIAACFALALCLAPSHADAHDYDRDDSDYFLRYVAYIVHPIGIGLEYAVTRPIHWLVSQPNLSIVFGHDPHESDEEDFFEWK